MTEIGSISLLLLRLGDGDEEVLADLHRRCWPWIVRTARQRLGGRSLRSIDEEDVAQEAFWGFVRSVRDGRTPQLSSRHHLFALLTHIVACKASSELNRHLTAKRGSGRVRGESAFDARQETSSTGSPGMQAVPDLERTPDEEAALSDCYAHYISALPEALRGVAEMHISGLTNREIAEQLGCVARTIERKLSLVRERWEEMARCELSR